MYVCNEYEIHSNVIHLHQGHGFDSQLVYKNLTKNHIKLQKA